MMRRAVLLLAALLTGAVMAATPAGAQAGSGADDNYGALCSPLSVTGTPSPGAIVTVSGTAATAGATIAIVLLPDTFLDSTTSAADRSFSKDVTIPADATGTIQIQAFQIGDNTDFITGCPSQVLSLDIVQPTTGEPLARTGAANSTLPLARLGFGLLAAGGLAVVVSRRRRTSVSANA